MKKRVVTIGGGTGSFVVLSGLKHHPVHISAIVSMADDGGSTGILRDEMGVLPPGDVRQCLAALSRATMEVRELFSYRFSDGDLAGHNAGNLFLSALEKTTGSFSRAVAVAGKILNVYGRVIPVTEGDMRLVVELNNGVSLEGESKLDDDEDVRTQGVRDITLKHPVEAHPDAIAAIQKADAVVIGPGDTFGSIIPNFLVHGISEALCDTSAKIIVVANATNKRGLTDGFNAHSYAKKVEQYLLGRNIDTLVCNTEQPSVAAAQRYEQQEGVGMFVGCEDIKTAYTIVRAPLLHADAHGEPSSDVIAHTRSFIRHDSEKLAKTILDLL